jgi:hypothetical protein
VALGHWRLEPLVGVSIALVLRDWHLAAIAGRVQPQLCCLRCGKFNRAKNHFIARQGGGHSRRMWTARPIPLTAFPPEMSKRVGRARRSACLLREAFIQPRTAISDEMCRLADPALVLSGFVNVGGNSLAVRTIDRSLSRTSRSSAACAIRRDRLMSRSFGPCHLESVQPGPRGGPDQETRCQGRVLCPCRPT